MENVFNQSIWGDEGFSAILSMKSVPDIIKVIVHDTSPPLWNLFEHFAFKYFGTGETVIRGLSFAFFLGAVFFIYKIGALLWNRKTGLIAAILTFLNPFFFTYAFEGRMYSIMAFGVSASMFFFLKIFYADETNRAMKAGYVAATLWALYSHHFAIFAIVIQGLWFLYEVVFGRRKRAFIIFRLFFVIAILYSPWLYPLYTQTKMVGGGFWLGTPTLKDLRNLIYEYLAEGIKNDGLVVPYLGTTFYHTALYASFAILLFRNWTKSIKKTIFMTLWFLGPITLTWLVSQKFQSIFFNRYLLYAIPGAMLILASNTRKVSLAALIVIIILFIKMDTVYFENPSKLPFRALASYVLENKKDGDFLINWYSNGTHHIWETKYYGIPASIYVSGNTSLPYFVGTALMEKGDIISSIPPDTNRIGVVTSGSIDEITLPGYTEKEAKSFAPYGNSDNKVYFVWYEKIQKPAK